MAYGKHFRSLKASSADQKEWTNKRDKLEKPLDVVYAEVFYRKYLSSKLFLHTGLSFFQSTSRFEELIENKYTEIIDNQFIEIIRYADGSEEEIYGESNALFSET